MKYFFTLVISMIISCTYAQTRIEGEIIAAPDNQVLLTEHFGEKVNIVDTITLDEDGRFVYHLHPKKPNGLYRLFISKNSGLDFILGWENLKFQTIANAPVESLEIQESWQNKKLYDFFELLDEQNKKVGVLRDFISNYPETDRLLKLSKKKAEKLYDERQDFLDDLKKNHPDAFITSYLSFLYEQPLEMFFSNNPELKHKTISSKNWSDTLLLNSDAYSSTLIEYLMLYGDRNAKRDEQISLYRQAIDSIFEFVPEHSPVYDYALLYLMDGFEQFKMEPLVLHLVENYTDNCSKTNGKLENRINYYKKFKNGATVPDFISTNLKEEPVNFYEEVTGKTLLVFWATWCGHCKQMMQTLSELYPQLKEKGIDIITVSLDHQPETLHTYLDETDLPFKVWCDFKGWESPVVEKYYIYATPTMLLLDKNKTIIGKPLNLNQLVYIINDM